MHTTLSQKFHDLILLIYLVQEFRDTVDVVVDHKPDIVVGFVLGHLLKGVELCFTRHFYTFWQNELWFLNINTQMSYKLYTILVV